MKRITFRTRWTEVREYTVEAPDETTEEEVFFHLSRYTDAEDADWDSLGWSEELEHGSYDVLSEEPDAPTVEVTVQLKVKVLQAIVDGDTGDEAASAEAVQGVFAADWDELMTMVSKVEVPK